MNFKRGYLQHDEGWSSIPDNHTGGEEDRLERLEKLILAQKDEQLKREAAAEAQRAVEKRMADEQAIRVAKEKAAAAEKAKDMLDAAKAAREEAERKAAVELQAVHKAYDKAVTEAKASGRHTISEDRSAGSNLEERRLAILKFRGASQEPSSAWDEAESSASTMHVPYSRGSSTGYVHPHRRFRRPQFEEEDSDESLEEEDPTSFGLSSPAEDVPTSNNQPQDRLLANHNWVEPVNQVDTDSELQFNIERLRQNIKSLQRELGGLEMEKELSSKNQFQILYRIDGACYFDQPEFTRGNRSIASRRPVKNLDLFLERNKHIIFLVYRDFDLSSTKSRVNKKLALPQHTWESIRPVSRHLRKTLEIMLKHDWRYYTMYSHLRQRRELDAPYLFIYHHRTIWKDILAQCAHTAREHLNLMALYVSENYGEEYMAADLSFANRKVTTNNIKYLFQPGDILVSRSSDQHRGLVAKSWPLKFSRYDYTYLESSIEEPESDDDIDPRNFEGKMGSSAVDEEPKEHREQESLKRFLQRTRPGLTLRGRGYNKTVSAATRSRDFNVDTWQWIFDGTFKRVASNVIFRLPQSTTNDSTREMEWEMHDLNLFPLKYCPPALLQSLRRRGMIFWQCRRRCLVTYHNSATDTEDEFDKRFMIDFPTFQRLHAGFKSYVADSVAESMTQHEMEQPEPPSDDFYYLVPSQTKGFNLTTKKWLDLNVDQIGPVAWNEKAFESLVLDKNRKTKELITALVSKQISSSKSTDAIAGKGNGLILLLHGGPGTGKTLTAEGVAELAKKPLYRVTCGDVGTKAEEVENYLESVLHLGKLWDCVVLLDEAEVFLERRSLDNLQRNALVSVFLRVIEYHEGILILTSNRVGTFDEAFRSRIQIAIHYPPLRAYQRLQIWKNFFDRLESFKDGSVDVDELRDHLEELQKFEINGRDIRNAITTARQYADWKGKTMNYEHLKIALNVAAEFNDYSEKLSGGFTDDQIAEEDGLR